MNFSSLSLISVGTIFFSSLFYGFNLYANNSEISDSTKVQEKELKWDYNSSTDKNTIYVAYWSHTPENCPGRGLDGAKMLSRFWEGRKEAEKKGIKILGAYVTVTEHNYYIIIEASDYTSVVEFFLPLVPSQTGKFAPVLTMDEWLKIMPK
jgi:uncharacterized protein with GYD domain